MGKFKRWWIKHRILSFYRRVYPRGYTYRESLMSLGLYHKSSLEDACINEIFTELVNRIHLVVVGCRFPHFRYLPRKVRTREVRNGKF